MTMDRVEGVDLLTLLSKGPWEARAVGRMLADLHHQLASIPIGNIEVPTKVGEREAFVHGDLHPGNVLLTDNGPVVIDWEGAGVGSADADSATTLATHGHGRSRRCAEDDPAAGRTDSENRPASVPERCPPTSIGDDRRSVRFSAPRQEHASP